MSFLVGFGCPLYEIFAYQRKQAHLRPKNIKKPPVQAVFSILKQIKSASNFSFHAAAQLHIFLLHIVIYIQSVPRSDVRIADNGIIL